METCQRSPADELRARPGSALAVCFILCLVVIATGCGSSSGTPANTPTPPVIAPAISMQPVNQSVPMGLTASYAVTATGSVLQFQWKKDGAAIAGATSSSYTTPATVFADTGASFAVTVSNSAGTIESNAASLTVTARAPMVGDLRFQQVDAPATVNGWGNFVALSTDLPGRFAAYYSPSIGTPFYVGSGGNCGSTPTTDGTGCDFFYSEQPFAAVPSSPPLVAGYGADFYDNFEADLQNNAWPGFGNGGTPITPVSSGSVITSLDLEPANVLLAVSWIQSMQQSGFAMAQNTVVPANLQAAAAQEGASGRVITATPTTAVRSLTCPTAGRQTPPASTKRRSQRPRLQVPRRPRPVSRRKAISLPPVGGLMTTAMSFLWAPVYRVTQWLAHSSQHKAHRRSRP